MSPELKDQLLQLLNEQAAIIAPNSSPKNYAGFRKMMLNLELDTEIQELRRLLMDDTVDFKEQFIQRCLWRASDTAQTISFRDVPQSQTNRLYWEIAALAFTPPTLKDMLAIIAPNVKARVELELVQPLHLPKIFGQRRAEDVLEPSLKRSPDLEYLASLDPDLEFLNHLVVTVNDLFVIQDIMQLPLGVHAKLQAHLQEKFPHIAESLYQHNHYLYALNQDIQNLRNKGTTPKAAIEKLIQGLIIGGSQMTGARMASDYAHAAMKRFFVYYIALPQATREHIRSLESGSRNLGSIIDNEIETGQCVETTSKYLKAILGDNKDDPILNTPPAMSSADMKQLKGKYSLANTQGNNAANTAKDPDSNPPFPAVLTKAALAHISPSTPEELILILINFPEKLYDLLIENINLSGRSQQTHSNSEFLHELHQAIEHQIFNPEQSAALTAALNKHINRFLTRAEYLTWSIRNKNPVIFREALNSIPQDERVATLEMDYYGGSIVSYIIGNQPELFNVMLELLTPAQRLAAVDQPDPFSHRPLIHNVVNKPTLFKTLLDLYPVERRFALIDQANNRGEKLITNANNAESIKMILDFYPEDQRSALVMHQSRNGASLLYICNSNAEVLKIILGLYPVDTRFKAVTEPSYQGFSVIHGACKDLASLKEILNLLPEDQRIPALETTNEDNATVLHSAAPSPYALKFILEQYPEDQRLAALAKKTKFGMPVLYLALMHKPASAIAILSALAPQDRHAAVLVETRDNDTMLKCCCSNPVKFKTIFEVYPDSEKMAALAKKSKSGLSALSNIISQNPKTFLAMIACFPEEQRLEKLRMSVDDKSVLRWIVESDNELSVPDDWFADSFTAKFIEIYSYLSKIINNSLYPTSGNLIQNHAIQLLNLFELCESFEDIDITIDEFVTVHPDSPIKPRVLSLIGRGEENDLQDQDTNQPQP